MNILALVIEDEQADIAIVRESLADTSAGSSQIAYATSLALGVQRLGAGDVDIVLLDLSLPDSEGEATLARLREASPDVPVLIIAGTEHRGATDATPRFILKDHVECHRLVDIVRRLVREARHRHPTVESDHPLPKP